MRILRIVILTLIVAYPDQVLSSNKRSKDKKSDAKGACGKPYMRQLNGRCYYFSVKKMNWFGAQNNCLRKGLNLANLGSPEDYKAVIRYLNTRGNMEDYWFGGNDLQAEGRFTYISNGRMVRYFGEKGMVQPTHRHNLDDCLEVRLRLNNTVVTDENCQEKQYFICEKFSEQKCAVATMDAGQKGQHSHEHLHHFHHDPAKGEDQGGSGPEGMESDSRPIDNTNSAEVGESSFEGPELEQQPGAEEAAAKEPGTETEGPANAQEVPEEDQIDEAPSEEEAEEDTTPSEDAQHASRSEPPADDNTAEEGEAATPSGEADGGSSVQPESAEATVAGESEAGATVEPEGAEAAAAAEKEGGATVQPEDAESTAGVEGENVTEPPGEEDAAATPADAAGEEESGATAQAEGAEGAAPAEGAEGAAPAEGAEGTTPAEGAEVQRQLKGPKVQRPLRVPKYNSR
ncbi:GL17024 [Drosophila persimilis]|uniref:GL17024 n=1 Tax=Drosophila persimilis TaxID=7234 RepID=B4GH21_DROPE|nr:GL17024 [Drosophila persimilis]